MPGMREIQSRIKSVKETKQITKAMKLISAAKLKKARIQLDETLPFFNRVKATMADILMHSANVESPFFTPRQDKEEKRRGYLILSGDKGLAGGYNHSIIKKAEEIVRQDPDSPLFIAGAVGRHYFYKKGYNVELSFDYPVQDPSVFRAREISEMLLEKFSKGELDEIYIIYTLLETSFSMKPTVMELLPLMLEELTAGPDMAGEDAKADEALIYLPSPEAVLEVLIPRYVKGIVYGALNEAFTSEQSARMTAMDNATANADKMLNTLNLHYNRARQAAITQEISEIIGGAEALK